MKKKKQEKNLQSQGEIIWMKGMENIVNLNSKKENENKSKENIDNISNISSCNLNDSGEEDIPYSPELLKDKNEKKSNYKEGIYQINYFLKQN